MNIGGRPRQNKAVNGEKAAEIAVQALVFIAGQPERIDRFLSLTGVDPGDLRALAPQPAFQLAVLDHLASDEALLLAFVAQAGLAPETVGHAREALGGGDRH